MAARRTELPSALDLRGPPADLHVVLFSVTGCVHCERVRARHLRHLVGTTRAGRPLKVSEAAIDRETPMKLFDASPATHRVWARRLGIRFAPTVAVFDGGGRLLAEPLVGALTDDFYGFYLDEMIDRAVAAAGRGTAAR